jgi:hypothetical protein
MLMLTLTFCGIVMLYRVCQPFNVLRAVLFAIATALCVLVISVPYLGDIVYTGWPALEFTLPQLLILIIVVQASFPISAFLIRAFDMMNIADETPAVKQ